MPLAFKPPEEWLTLFKSHGLAVVTMEWLGSRVERLFHHPLLFVLDKSVAGEMVRKATCPSSGPYGEQR